MNPKALSIRCDQQQAHLRATVAMSKLMQPESTAEQHANKAAAQEA